MKFVHKVFLGIFAASIGLSVVGLTPDLALDSDSAIKTLQIL